MSRIVKIGGVFNFAFVALHLSFWQVFDWPANLRVLSEHDAVIVQVLNMWLIVAFAIFGYLSLFHTRDLISTGLGKSVLWSIAIFWLLRSVIQTFFLDLHVGTIVFLGIFMFGFALYAWSAKSVGDQRHVQA
ncbi:MAG: hypothetical protein HQ514_04240 [Rhodospirillales bacterium]|nr:hypothetical protein [Rhodospirillales bacterium]